MDKQTVLKILDAVFLIAGGYVGLPGALALRLLKRFLENKIDDILAEAGVRALAAGGDPKQDARAAAAVVLDYLGRLVAGYPVWPRVVEVLRSVVAGPLFDIAWDAFVGNTRVDFKPEHEAALKAVAVEVDAACLA